MNGSRETSSSESPYRQHWHLEPGLAFLNHGSFGACPRAVLERQREFVALMEQDPVRFFNRHRQPLLDSSRKALGATIGADPSDLVFDTNATHAANAVLRWLDLRPGDEILVTNHGYNAITNAARYAAAQAEAQVTVIQIPVPVVSADEITAAIVQAIKPHTRLAILDHITSPTAIVMPLEQLLPLLHERNVVSLVDGAHAPGAIPLDLATLGADFYFGNCHKWLCSPRGAAFLYTQPQLRSRDVAPIELQPAAVSHGYNTQGPQQNRFHDAFDFPGTTDPTAWLCVGPAIEFLTGLADGDFTKHMQRNRQLAMAAAQILTQRCGLSMICPPELLGPMVSLVLPDDPRPTDLDYTSSPNPTLMLQTILLEKYAVEVPVFHFPQTPQRMLRISAQAYNAIGDYERLADALCILL